MLLGWRPVQTRRLKLKLGQAMDLLKVTGVEPQDFFKAANDTTNTALKVGRLLTVGKENGTCTMHQVQLALVHAIGAKTRTKNSKVVDSFEEAQVLHKKESIKAASYLQDKKDKNRVLLYKAEMEAIGRSAKWILLPNSTRAAGNQLHYESMITARWNFYHHWHKHPTSKSLENPDIRDGHS
jgi:hypothetical protein